MTQAIKDFIAAGEKATQGEWEFTLDEKYVLGEGGFIADGKLVMSFGDDADYYPTEGQPPNSEDTGFIIKAANTRADIKSMYELMEEAERVLVNIGEYWNRDQNESAMADALWHNIEIADTVLAKFNNWKEGKK